MGVSPSVATALVDPALLDGGILQAMQYPFGPTRQGDAASVILVLMHQHRQADLVDGLMRHRPCRHRLSCRLVAAWFHARQVKPSIARH